MTTFLDMMQSVIDEGAFGTITGGIVSNDNDLARRLKSISNRVVNEMSEKYPWRELWKTGTVTLVDGTASYALPADFNYFHVDTFYNTNSTLPLRIINPNELGYLNGSNIDDYPVSQFYIRGIATNTFFINPTPGSGDDGDIISFEYASDRVVRPKTWAASQTITATDTYRFYNGNYYTSTNTGTTGATPPTHTSGTVSDGTVSWAYYSGSYTKFLDDTDEINLNERIFMQGVLERLSVTSGQTVVPSFDRELLALWSRQAPAGIINASGFSSAFTYGRDGKVIFSSGL